MVDNYGTISAYVLTDDILKKMTKDELIAYAHHARNLFFDYEQVLYENEQTTALQNSLLDKLYDLYDARERLSSQQRSLAKFEFDLAEKYSNEGKNNEI